MLLEKISLLSDASISTSLAMPAGKSQHGEGSPLTLPRTANDTTKIGMRFRRSISHNVPKRNSRIPTIRTALRRNVSARKRRFRKEERVGISIRPSPCVYSSVRNRASSSGSATRHGCSLSSSARPASVSEKYIWRLSSSPNFRITNPLPSTDRITFDVFEQVSRSISAISPDESSPCRARQQHSLVHRQAIFPLETLFELGDRARHFAYAAERIHRTISTDTPRSPF